MPRPAEALLVVDLQPDFFVDDELAACRDDLLAHVGGLDARARRAGAPVVLVRTVHAPDKSTWTISMLEDDQAMAVAGTPGADWLPGLRTEGATTVTKTRDSAFFGTDLEAVLRQAGVTTIALCGVSTESCIRATAADAFALDLRVILVDRATASFDPRLHRAVLDQLAGLYRMPVLDPDDVAFTAPRGAPRAQG